MTAYPPQAIRDLFGRIKQRIPQAVFSGIVGDVAHSFGYHLARNDLPASDYSVRLPLDRQGDGAAASALDISLPPDLMITVTSRLVAAAKAHDPRLRALRSFCGTTNGSNPHPFDLSTGTDDPANTQGWDASHLWHVHLSIYRAFANDAAAIASIADVMAGAWTPTVPTPSPTPPSPQEDEHMIYVTVSTHPTSKRKRGWITGPKGVVEVDEATARSAARMLGRPVVEVAEPDVVLGRPGLGTVLG